MRVLLSWLKELITFESSPEELDNTLTLAGLEVDSIENAQFSFEGIVVGKVTSTEPHPDANRLKIAKVYDGKEEHTVVCGGANCRPDLLVAFAPVGSTLQEGNGKSFTIRKAKLRGVESFGMLCGADELQLSKKASEGILELPDNAPIGAELAKYLYDPIIEVSLTPNLGHAASILGIARELSAQLQVPYTLPSSPIKNESDTPLPLSCSIGDPQGCSQYHLRMVQGVKVGPSPDWMRDRLEKSGFGCVNNIVDAINYVMMEMGQPMHAFDLNRLPHRKINVKKSLKPFKMPLLDGSEKEIKEGTLLIYDADEPIAIAGVMGGESTAINDSTTDIIIEAAQFDPSFVRASAKQNNVRSDSSYRFERGIDPQGVRRALDRAAELIQKVAGGTPSKECVSAVSAPFEAKQIDLRIAQIERLIGIHLSESEVRDLLERLECEVKGKEDAILSVTPPSYRNDLLSEIDLIEEVTRLYGFNNIARKTCRFAVSSTSHHPLYLIEKKVRDRLIREGLQEFLTCNLISPSLSKVGQTIGSESHIPMRHAKSVDQSILRASFLPGLLSSIKHNENHQRHDISAFEIGTLHFRDGEKYLEKHAAAIILCGKRAPYHFSPKPRDIDFFDLKGHVENLLEELDIKNIAIKASNHNSFHPGQQGEVHANGELIAVIGQVHPDECAKLGLDRRKKVYYGQIDIEKIAQLEDKLPQFSGISLYPASQRDITLTLDEGISIAHLFEEVKSVKAPSLKSIELVDIFKDVDRLGAGKQNVTLRLTYRDDNKTIEMKQVDEEHAQITQKVTLLEG